MEPGPLWSAAPSHSPHCPLRPQAPGPRCPVRLGVGPQLEPLPTRGQGSATRQGPGPGSDPPKGCVGPDCFHCPQVGVTSTPPLPTTTWNDPSCLAPPGPSLGTSSLEAGPSHVTYRTGTQRGTRTQSLGRAEDPPRPGACCAPEAWARRPPSEVWALLMASGSLLEVGGGGPSRAQGHPQARPLRPPRGASPEEAAAAQVTGQARTPAPFRSRERLWGAGAALAPSCDSFTPQIDLWLRRRIFAFL